MKHKTQPIHTTQPQVPLTTAHSEAAAIAGSTDKNAAEPTLVELQAENAALKKQLQEQAAHASLKDKLKQAGARTPQLLLGAAKDALKFTVAGELENAVEIIEALKEKFPEQFGSTNHPSGSAPAAVPSIDAGARPPSAPTLTREALARMTPAQIAELNWDDVRRVLSHR